ncbi:MAG: hypothetical protein U0790_05330 [Isosphaeraceae bacterium]
MEPAESSRRCRANLIQPAQLHRNDFAFSAVWPRLARSSVLTSSGLVVGVFQGRSIFLKDAATVRDGPAEVSTHVRHGWGPSLAASRPSLA